MISVSGHYYRLVLRVLEMDEGGSPATYITVPLGPQLRRMMEGNLIDARSLFKITYCEVL